MNSESVKGVGGWLLIYMALSIPLMMIYAMGLSGMFFEYPFGLMVGIFAVLAMPLVLLLRKSPRAPRWNMIGLWTMAVLMFIRAAAVILVPDVGQGPKSVMEAMGVIGILSLIVGVAFGWAAVWTIYFRRSSRVRNTFSPS